MRLSRIDLRSFTERLARRKHDLILDVQYDMKAVQLGEKTRIAHCAPTSILTETIHTGNSVTDYIFDI